jgi:3-oxoacyl-[acyl-carrier-protein] synthase II
LEAAARPRTGNGASADSIAIGLALDKATDCNPKREGDMRRVVVTGLGMVTPLGCGVEESWQRLIAGESGARKVDRFNVSDLPSKIACMIPRGDGTNGTYNPDRWMEPKEQRKVDEFITFAMCAAHQALDDAGWRPADYDSQVRSGVMIGSGIGGIEGIAETAIVLKERGPRRVSPFFIPGRLINLAGGYVSIAFGLKGPNHAVVTACSTGAHAIGDAGRLIALGDAEVMVAGGTESPINRLSMAGFSACRALSTSFNDDPTRASRPYDRDRDGFVIAEGAGVVVLEELEHAQRRGARIYAELIGYGLSGDAHHITAPAEDGDGAQRCMAAAIKRAAISPAEIDYINAHGTSTPLGDEIELAAVQRIVGNAAGRVSMSSTKSSIGHLLGAAGAVEAIFSILAIRDNVAPPTINLDNPSVDTPIDLVPHKAKKREINVVLTNSFGFGGTNASLVLRRLQ